jgi:predicted metal-dependent hydrolase
MMAPPNVLDYVVAHEVSHLKHMDHSKKFWRLCYDLSDNPEEARAWLKNEGNGLFRYF